MFISDEQKYFGLVLVFLTDITAETFQSQYVFQYLEQAIEVPRRLSAEICRSLRM